MFSLSRELYPLDIAVQSAMSSIASVVIPGLSPWRAALFGALVTQTQYATEEPVKRYIEEHSQSIGAALGSIRVWAKQLPPCAKKLEHIDSISPKAWRHYTTIAANYLAAATVTSLVMTRIRLPVTLGQALFVPIVLGIGPLVALAGKAGSLSTFFEGLTYNGN